MDNDWKIKMNCNIFSSWNLLRKFLITLYYHHSFVLLLFLVCFFYFLYLFFFFLLFWFFFFWVIHPTREFFTHLKTSPLPIKGCKFYTFARHLWPLSSEGSLACHTYCNTGHPFIMIISGDPWHSHVMQSVW